MISRVGIINTGDAWMYFSNLFEGAESSARCGLDYWVIFCGTRACGRLSLVWMGHLQGSFLRQP